MQRKLLILGCVFGMLAVILGAFGAHGLKVVLTEESLTSYETGVRYQFYHAFLALIIANTSFFTDKTKNVVFWMLLVGVLLFSGSIYLHANNVFNSLDKYSNHPCQFSLS